ncbi:hypothetical protein TNCT_672501 [Trichonephila clavata]|uniref:Uncharacterized protein n=1 Tax=Trichonephila clavata TaxID=2740835 RepID=A0A8X6HL68_TRICU|nr:hypothetical protein TNCT_672501 [Trichonephila clavata]
MLVEILKKIVPNTPQAKEAFFHLAIFPKPSAETYEQLGRMPVGYIEALFSDALHNDLQMTFLNSFHILFSWRQIGERSVLQSVEQLLKYSRTVVGLVGNREIHTFFECPFIALCRE